MRQCINPACPAFAEGRVFNDDDVTCPRCGQPLAEVSDDGVVTPVAAAPAADKPMSQGCAIVLALAIFIGVVGLALGVAGLLRGFGPPGASPGEANPTVVASSPEEATAIAAATHTAVAAAPSGNTPIPIVNLPTPVGGTGSTGGSTASGGTGSTGDSTASGATGATSTGGTPAPSSATSGSIQSVGPTSAVIPGVSAWRLCRRIAASEACDPVTSFGTADAMNVGIQAGFGPGGATSARVDWYGPNGGLLQSSAPLTPGRTGTFWVAFTIKQSVPWLPGIYRSVIFLDNTVQRQIDIPVIP